MDVNVQEIKQKALNLARKMSTVQLIEAFEMTNEMSPADPSTAFVRGNLLDVLEERDPISFAAWMDCEDPKLIDNIRYFYNI
jgi:hypothetical protein